MLAHTVTSGFYCHEMQADKNTPGKLGAIIQVGISAHVLFQPPREALMPPFLSLNKNKIPDSCIY